MPMDFIMQKVLQRLELILVFCMQENIFSLKSLLYSFGDEYLQKKKAPTFCLFNQNDEKVCLENFKDKWIILYFYPKDNTKSCTLEALSFTHNVEWFNQKGAIVIGVSPDSVKSHKNFSQKNNLDLIPLWYRLLQYCNN